VAAQQTLGSVSDAVTLQTEHATELYPMQQQDHKLKCHWLPSHTQRPKPGSQLYWQTILADARAVNDAR
jgi:hypothetical protein